MLKKMFLCCLLFVLVGCTKTNADINSWIDDYIVKLSKEKINIVNNHYKKYYDYYVPKNISNIESTDIHNIFKSNNTDIIMSVDISSIINRKLYSNYDIEKNIYGDDCLVYSNDRASFQSIFYYINIYEIQSKYLVEIKINDVNLVSYTNLDNLQNILRHMLILGSSTNVYEDTIIADFSHKDIIDYQKEQVDLFEMIVPKDGLLIELIEPNSDVDPNVNEDLENTDPLETENSEDIDSNE